MPRIPLTCSLAAGIVFLAAAAHAQTTPSSTAAQAPEAAANAQPAGPVTTLRANTRLVVVDVVVTDPAGKPLHNLKQSDFNLSEKNQPQTISHFEEHSSSSTPAKPAPMPRLDPGVFTNYSPAPVEGALNVLLLDSLNTPMQDQAVVRQEMLKYLKTARPGTRMAIFGLNQKLHLLQGFTTDPEILRTIIDKGLAKASSLMDNPVSGDTVGADTMSDTMTDMLGNDPGSASIIANMQQFEAQQAAFQLMLRTGYTLDALNVLGRYLSGLPGRKNLIWFSGSFPVDILPDGDLTDPFAIAATFEDEFRETTNILARAQVAVYPIDARGLMVAPMMSAANSGAKYAKNPTAFGKDQTKFFNQTASEHSTMMMMAEDTGGKAFVNTNGLKEAVDKAVEIGANYYTLTYTPSNKDWNGDYRKIKVDLTTKGYTLAYRHGYYADDPDTMPRSKKGKEVTAAIAATAVQTFEPMRVAMQFGAPDPVQIIFTAAVLPVTGQPEPDLAKGVHAEPKVVGPFTRYIIGYSVNSRGVVVAQNPDGKRHLSLEFVAFLYDADGALVTSSGSQLTGDIASDRYTQMIKGGMQYRQEISVPINKKGPYFLRIGVHDLTSDHTGALEIPISRVARLTPYTTQAAPPASNAPATPAPEPKPAPKPEQ